MKRMISIILAAMFCFLLVSCQSKPATVSGMACTGIYICYYFNTYDELRKAFRKKNSELYQGNEFHTEEYYKTLEIYSQKGAALPRPKINGENVKLDDEKDSIVFFSNMELSFEVPMLFYRFDCGDGDVIAEIYLLPAHSRFDEMKGKDVSGIRDMLRIEPIEGATYQVMNIGGKDYMTYTHHDVNDEPVIHYINDNGEYVFFRDRVARVLTDEFVSTFSVE